MKGTLARLAGAVVGAALTVAACGGCGSLMLAEVGRQHLNAERRSVVRLAPTADGRGAEAAIDVGEVASLIQGYIAAPPGWKLTTGGIDLASIAAVVRYVVINNRKGGGGDNGQDHQTAKPVPQTYVDGNGRTVIYVARPDGTYDRYVDGKIVYTSDTPPSQEAAP